MSHRFQIICLETPLLFIGKSYPLFITIFVISILFFSMCFLFLFSRYISVLSFSEVQIIQKVGNERENSYWKSKEISRKKHTQTHGSLIETFWRSQMSLLIRVYTYIYTLLIDKSICDCWNVSIKLQCVCVCFSPGDLFIFSIRVSFFFSYYFGFYFDFDFFE